MRPTKYLITALGFLFLFAGTINADENSGAWEPLTASVQQEPLNSAVPIYRAFVNVRSEKFTFLMPEGFRLAGDPAHGRLQVDNPDANVHISFIILGPVPADSPPLNAASYREMLLQRYAGGKILGEFQGSAAGGQTGPGFDIERPGPAGLAQRIRIVYLPTVAGVLELTVTSGTKNFSVAKSNLSDLLGSLRCSENGKLVFPHLSDKA